MSSYYTDLDNDRGADLEAAEMERELNGVVCCYCGRKNLHWGKINGRWRTFCADDTIHRCRKHS